MKIMKYAFISPLHGSIECADVLPNEDRVELNARQMCKLYSEEPDLEEFLARNRENLASCVDEEFMHSVLRAEFGDVAMIGGRLYLRTYIWTHSELTDEGIAKLMDWISGQMSDGWGEGLEQRAWTQQRVEVPSVYFDPDSLTFESETDEWYTSYYVHPWNSEDFSVNLQNYEEVDVGTPETVASLWMPNYRREVQKFTDTLSLIMFFKAHGREDIVIDVQSGDFAPGTTFYVATNPADHTITGKWAFESDVAVVVYDSAVPLFTHIIDTNLNTQEAIMKLLA